MELIHLISPLFFYFKFAFVFLLFILNIYFICAATHNKESVPNKELQSGFNLKRFKGVLTTLGTIGGFLSAIITMQNELKNIQIGKIDQLVEAERAGIRKSIDQDREEHQRILNTLNSNREELYNLHIAKAKLFGHNDRLLTLHNSIKENVISYQDKSVDPTAKLSDLGILDQLIKQDTNKFAQELDYLVLNTDNPLGEGSSSESHKGTIPDTLDSTENLKESSVFDFNIITSMDWFEGLNGIKKLAVSLILGKSVIFSALISIIFIFYGNILIEKYDLENRYPKLAIFIKLRRKFQKYYLNYYCGLIIIIIITEVAFALAVLFWL